MTPRALFLAGAGIALAGFLALGADRVVAARVGFLPLPKDAARVAQFGPIPAYGPLLPITPIKSVAQVSSATCASTSTTCTGTGLSIGTAASARLVVVGCYAALSSAGNSSAASVGGVSATQIDHVETLGGIIVAGLYAIQVGTGTTANVICTTSQTQNPSGIIVWAVQNAPVMAFAHSTSTANPSVASSLNVPAQGIAIGFTGQNGGGNPGAPTWTNLTSDTVINPNVNNSTAGASKQFATAQTNLDAEANWGGSPTSIVSIFASW